MKQSSNEVGLWLRFGSGSILTNSTEIVGYAALGDKVDTVKGPTHIFPGLYPIGGTLLVFLDCDNCTHRRDFAKLIGPSLGAQTRRRTAHY